MVHASLILILILIILSFRHSEIPHVITYPDIKYNLDLYIYHSTKNKLLWHFPRFLIGHLRTVPSVLFITIPCGIQLSESRPLIPDIWLPAQ